MTVNFKALKLFTKDKCVIISAMSVANNCINGVTAAEIASFEGIAQQNVSKSIASAKKKLKKFLKNRV